MLVNVTIPQYFPNKIVRHVSGLGEKFCNGPGTEFLCYSYHLFFGTFKLIIYIYKYFFLI